MQYPFSVTPHTVNCGPPSLPSNGYIIPYADTFEGAEVTYLCWTAQQTQYQLAVFKQTNVTTVCNAEGIWEPDSDNICAEPSDSGILLDCLEVTQ